MVEIEVTLRLTEDQTEALEAYMWAHDIGESEAIERLIDTSLRATAEETLTERLLKLSQIARR